MLDDPEPRSRLPLWDPSYDKPIPGLQTPLERDPGCRRCSLGSKRRHVENVCMAGGGDPGGILVILESPTQADDAAGKFVVGSGGFNKIAAAAVAPYTEKHGPVRYVWAVSCPARKQATSDEIEACRPYLALEFSRGPQIALAFGPTAAEACTGVHLDARVLRRAWTTVQGVPTVFLPPLYLAATNKFWWSRLKADVEWAFLARGSRPSLDGDVRIALSRDEAVELLSEFNGRWPVAYDTEHWPKNPWAPEFTLLCVGLYSAPTGAVVIPGEVAVQVRAELARILADPATPKWTANGKHDRHVIWRALGFDVRGMDWDVGLVAQLLASEDRKGLGPLAWQVGLGGLKALGQSGAEDED